MEEWAKRDPWRHLWVSHSLGAVIDNFLLSGYMICAIYRYMNLNQIKYKVSFSNLQWGEKDILGGASLGAA
jgi:hypothetical protein